jgi:hypothetical protein
VCHPGSDPGRIRKYLETTALTVGFLRKSIGESERNGAVALLRRHENLMKEQGWILKRNPDGSHTWTTPHGHKYITGTDPP